MTAPHLSAASSSTFVSGNPVESILAGGGEMGALMRDFDWASTPIGPPATWPQSLRTSLGILLDSRFPTYIGWGAEFIGFYNDAYRPILGSTKHPGAIGRSTAETFAESWDEYIGPLFRQVMEEGRPTFIEDWHLPLDRHGYLEECFFTFCYSAIRDESGRVGGVLVTVVETTARVIGERRLRVLRDLAARGAEASTVTQVCAGIESVVHANPHDLPFALVYLPDRGGVLRLAASAGIDSTGEAAPIELNPDDVRPWPVRRVLDAGGTEVVEALPPLSLVGAHPWPEPPRCAMILPIGAGQDGATGVLIAGVSPRRALDDEYRAFFDLVAGQIASAIGNARSHEQERSRAEALAELDRAKTTFFSNISHEFRTPLTLLLGPIADALEDDSAPLNDVQRERMLVARRNAQRLLKLVNALLDFSRIEAGRVRGVFRPVRIDELTTDLASSFRSLVERAGLRFTVECEAPDAPVYVDVEMWEKVVLNLLSNAFKFTFDGGIAVRLRAEAGQVVLTVADSGTGIPAMELPHVFDRFRRVEGMRSRSFEGSGIGLSLVRELVRLHAGSVDITSEEGRGTTVTVVIPTGYAHLPTDHLSPDEERARMSGLAGAFIDEAGQWLNENASNTTPAPWGGAPHLNHGGRGRVLIVDDNADMRAYLARLLAPLFEVATAANGATAMSAIRAQTPDVVLADVMMPVMNGFELVRAVRADPRLRTVALMLISARAGEEATVEALQAGADEYIVKPFSAREVIARIQSRVEIVHTRAQAERRLAEIIHLAPAFICVLRGPEHVFEMTNPPYDDLIDHRPVLGRPVREALPEVEAQGFLDLLDRVYETGEPFTANEAAIDLQDSRGQLRTRYINFVYQALRDSDGSVTGIMAHGVDVTAQVEARKQLEVLYREVTDANRAKADFLSMMSHELRTPLNAIIGFTDLLTLGVRGPITPEQSQDLVRIERASKYLLGLINDILNFSKIEAGQVQVRPSDFRLDAIIAETASVVAPLFAERELHFEADTSSEDRVCADPDRVRQILLNLLTNAIKFTGRGGRVRIETERDARVVRIRVCDTGRGIPPEQIGRIFEPFVQVQAPTYASSQGGVGLGLTISRELARAMGGDLVAESHVGVGSTFTFTLPRAASA